MRRGVICYDAHCPICLRMVRRFGHALRRAGFQFAALQDSRIQRRLGISQLPDEMKLILPNGEVQGGIDAVLTLSEALGLAHDMVIGARSRFLRPVLKHMYVYVATHRKCVDGTCRVHNR